MPAQARFQCADCGAVLTQWSGRCPECRAWNTVQQASPVRGAASPVQTLSALPVAGEQRLLSGIAELDRTLGGGLVPGSVILIGGDPGMGKSTLLLQTLAALDAAGEPVLYVSGEESVAQLTGHARRLRLPTGRMRLLTENELECVLQAAEAERPRVLVIDSVQTLYSRRISATPGSVTQLRECAGACVRLAKRGGATVFLIGHVTKEGVLAGPRLLEHMVDTVLYFEGDVGSRHRLLRSVKNRYGAISELGVFAMTDRGLREVSNPSAIFLSRSPGQPPGSVVMVTREGTRPLLVEVQALVDEARASSPRRLGLGLAQNRLDMLLAVLHRHGSRSTHGHDVFVNVVGGIRVSETAADLPILLAIASSLSDRPLARDLAAFGEVGLAGEIRPVPGGMERLQAAAKHGFRRVIVPCANQPKAPLADAPELEIVAAARLGEALELALSASA